MLRVIAGAGQGGGPTLAPGRYRTARQAAASPRNRVQRHALQARLPVPSMFEMLHPLRSRSPEAVRARIPAGATPGGSLDHPPSLGGQVTGGAGTRRRSTRVNGFAVGTAPAARCASAAIACRIRSRPGGVAELITVSARPGINVRHASAAHHG